MSNVSTEDLTSYGDNVIFDEWGWPAVLKWEGGYEPLTPNGVHNWCKAHPELVDQIKWREKTNTDDITFCLTKDNAKQ